jgi:tetratricopeptide (TPR) repeat protein
MRIKSIVLLVFSIINLSSNIATAKPTPVPQSSPQSIPTLTPYEQQTKQIEELQRSQAIEKKVKEEVDRTLNAVFGFTITLINLNIGAISVLLILFPIIGAGSLWYFRTSIIRQLESDITEKIEKVKSDIAEKIEVQKKFVDDFTSEIKNTIRDAQQARDIMEQEKDRIIQELSKLAPPLASIPDTHQPDVQKQIQELTGQLEDLKLADPQLFLTTDDYLKQGDAFFFEGNYKEAIKSYDEVIKRQDDSYSAWSSRGWALRRIDNRTYATGTSNGALRAPSAQKLHKRHSNIWTF